jgi:hypothetical protein
MWLLILVATSVCIHAQEDEDERYDDTTLRCVRVRTINRIKAIDESTLAFYMSNRDVYINALPRKCSGLLRAGRFAYESSGGRLCNKDRISPIYDMSGQDIGLPCPLGDFRRADAQFVEQMTAARELRGGLPPVTAESVELPPADDSQTSTPDSHE